MITFGKAGHILYSQFQKPDKVKVAGTILAKSP
jgi:hypothetical protein